MQIKFSPKKLINLLNSEEVESPFEGYIELKILPFLERFKKAKDLSLSVTKEGEVELNKDADVEEQMKRLVELVKKHSTDVKIKRKSGFEFKSIDELGYDEDGTTLILQAGQVILRGPKLGEN